jgi:hypothetical protein
MTAAPRPAQTDEQQTALTRFWHAQGFFDGAHQAFQREPSDHTARLRELAVLRLARAKRELLGGERP